MKNITIKYLFVLLMFVLAIALTYFIVARQYNDFKKDFLTKDSIVIVSDLRNLTDNQSRLVMQCMVDFASSAGSYGKKVRAFSLTNDACYGSTGKYDQRFCFWALESSPSIMVSYGPSWQYIKDGTLYISLDQAGKCAINLKEENK